MLLEQARAPGAARREVDALLRGLVLPVPPGEDARGRAEFLHDLLEDRRVCSFTGSNGRRVAHVAVEALEALGYPHALLVPPELLEEARAARLQPPTPREEVVSFSSSVEPERSRTVRQLLGGVMVFPVALLGGGLVFVTATKNGNPGLLLVSFLWVGGALGASFFAPSPPVVRTRWLHWLLLLMAAVPALALVAGGLIALSLLKGSELGLFFGGPPLLAGLLQLVGTVFLYGSPPPEASDSEA